MTMTEGFLLGVAGGAIPEIYALWCLRYEFHSNKPGWIKSWFYWILTIIMIGIGGGTVCLYINAGININAYMAIHLGIATPVMIGSLLKEKEKAD